MNTPNLLDEGDLLEKQYWPELQSFFPHYEEFWRVHLYPLREAGSIHMRDGVDEKFEYLAMYHYTVFVSLGRAYEKIQNHYEDFLFPDEIYWNLSRAAEVATKLVGTFVEIHQESVGSIPNVNTVPLNVVLERTRAYRNLIHQQIQATSTDENHHQRILVPGKIEQFPKWSDVKLRARPDDFIDVNQQLNNDFRALCSSLETAWKDLCKLSEVLVTNKQYLQIRDSSASTMVRLRFPPGSLVSPSVSGVMITRISSSSEDGDE